MKRLDKYLLITIIALLTGCTEKTTSLSQVNLLKQETNKILLSSFPNQVKDNNIEYQKEIQLLNNIISKINKSFFGIDVIELHIVKEDSGGMATALPNNNLLITTYFLDAISDFFTEEEVTAIMCHESSHILNDDWTNNFRKTYFTLNYSITVPDPIGFNIGYLLSKAFGGLSGISYKEYIEIHNKYSMELNTMMKDYSSVLNKGTMDFDLFLLQGFPIEVEKEADRMTKTCLDELNIDSINMLNVLKKLKTLDKVNLEAMDIRITHLRNN